MTKYDVFVRNWWKLNADWPNGLEPHAGKRKYIARGLSREEAYKLCQEYARNHAPGRLSRKAEFEEA